MRRETDVFRRAGKPGQVQRRSGPLHYGWRGNGERLSHSGNAAGDLSEPSFLRLGNEKFGGDYGNDSVV